MTRISRSRRIYPVELKPASSIDNWGKWPQDVESLLRAWNGRHGGHKLSFNGPYASTFKCPDCSRFCIPHKYGAAYLDGGHICDDCLIARARASLVTTCSPNAAPTTPPSTSSAPANTSTPTGSGGSGHPTPAPPAPSRTTGP